MDFQKLSKYTLFTFLFSLPFQTVLLLREPMMAGEKWQYGTIGLYGTDILLILSVFFAFLSFVIPVRQSADKHPAGIQKDNLGSRVKPGMTTLSLMTFVLWSGLSIFWASDQVLVGYFFMKLLLGASVFFLARSLDESDVKTVLKVLLAAAVIQSVIGIGQFVSQESVSSSLLGMSAHESWQAGTSVLKSEGGRFLRAYGSFPHPNMLGGFLAVTLVLGISYFVFGVKTFSVIASGAKQSREKNLSQMLSGLPRARRLTLAMTTKWAGLLTILLALILTFSRAAWLGVAMGIVAYCVFRIRYHVSGKKCLESGSNIISRPWNYVTEFRGMFGVLLVVGVATAVFVFVLREQVFPRFDTATIEREGSVSERMVSLEDAKTLIAEHSFLGVGAGNFTKAIMENEPTRPAWSVQPAHNVFVLVWAELGIIGVVLFVIFLLSAIASVVKQSRNQEKSLDCHGDEASPRNDREGDLILKNQNVIFATAFLILLPSLLLDHWLWSSHFGLLFLFLLAGLVSRKN